MASKYPKQYDSTLCKDSEKFIKGIIDNLYVYPQSPSKKYYYLFYLDKASGFKQKTKKRRLLNLGRLLTQLEIDAWNAFMWTNRKNYDEIKKLETCGFAENYKFKNNKYSQNCLFSNLELLESSKSPHLIIQKLLKKLFIEKIGRYAYLRLRPSYKEKITLKRIPSIPERDRLKRLLNSIEYSYEIRKIKISHCLHVKNNSCPSFCHFYETDKRKRLKKIDNLYP